MGLLNERLNIKLFHILTIEELGVELLKALIMIFVFNANLHIVFLQKEIQTNKNV